MKSEILYGIHSVYEAIAAGHREIIEIYCETEEPARQMKKLITLADSRNLPVKVIGSKGMKSTTGFSAHQGVAAKVGPYVFYRLKDILPARGSTADGHLMLLIDNVVDPHNLGAIVRTALCAGVEGIIIPKDRAAGPTPTVSRISAGALEHTKLVQVTNIVRTMTDLKTNGFWMVGTDQHAGQSIFTANLTGRLGILIGGEGKGIRPLVKQNCDFLISIPQSGPLDSLNASAAAAVILYEAYRQRNS